MRAVIYARYSSDLQSDRSIEDQVEICRRYCATQGWRIEHVYADRAISGASAQRPEYQRMLSHAQARRFDVIITEALDRLGRRVADVSGLHDQLSFCGIKLHTVATGELTALMAGILGSVGQQFLLDLRHKTKRGQLGRVLSGKSGGGLAYGYRTVKDRIGEREIDAAEANIVMRIFQEFADGHGPREIASRLNTDKVPGPGGRLWGDTTIRGQIDRGTGILNNALYVGRLEWNRCSYVKDPRTGKRVARPNPQDQWEVVNLPELRIVDDALWQRVKARQSEVRFEMGKTADGNPLNRAHRRQFLFSGLLTCGCCGAAYSIVAKDRYGCTAWKSKGTCGNSRTLSRQAIERRLLAGLKGKLLAPELVEEFVREFQAEINKAAAESAARASILRRDLDAVRKGIASIIRAIEDGMYNPSMRYRMTELETRKATLEADLAAATPPEPLRIHPRLPEVYGQKVAALEAALNASDTRVEAGEAIRSLISRVELTPDAEAPDGFTAALYGDLAEVLTLCGEQTGQKRKLPDHGGPGSLLSVVAGARFELTTFRL